MEVSLLTYDRHSLTDTFLMPPCANKKVSFADDNGQTLCMVKVFDDSGVFDESFDSTLADDIEQEGATNRPVPYPVTDRTEHNPSHTQPSQLALNFHQPASNYVAFKKRLVENFVGLENVILNGMFIMGTIKVLNVAFEKRVRIHGSSDGWKNCNISTEAYYLPQTAKSMLNVDTFSFNFEVPQTGECGEDIKVQFAVCYEVNGLQYWDNNDGKNYEVVSVKHKNGMRDFHGGFVNPVLGKVHGVHDIQWTEFVSYSSTDHETHYW